MLIEPRVAENINILHGRGYFKYNILLDCSIYEIPRLFCLVESMWELVAKPNRVTTLRARVK